MQTSYWHVSGSNLLSSQLVFLEPANPSKFSSETEPRLHLPWTGSSLWHIYLRSVISVRAFPGWRRRQILCQVWGQRQVSERAVCAVEGKQSYRAAFPLLWPQCFRENVWVYVLTHTHTKQNLQSANQHPIKLRHWELSFFSVLYVLVSYFI